MYDDLQLDLTSTVDRAAEEIRRALFAGQLAPGTPLREIALSEAMGVGRSTIREALGLLVAEGVAVRIPHKGVAVKELTADDVRDVSRARVALETAGVRRWRHATEAERQSVRNALADYATFAHQAADVPLDPAQLTESHLQIHRAFVGLTGSTRLLAAADSLSAEIRLGLAQLDRTRANVRDQVKDHRMLIELLESGDLRTAMTALDSHLAAAEASLLEATGNADESVQS
ncbi:MAG: GntR family transcriptional regulator [Nocardioidaceae bacterium]